MLKNDPKRFLGLDPNRLWPSVFALFRSVRLLPLSGCHLDAPDKRLTSNLRDLGFTVEPSPGHIRCRLRGRTTTCASKKGSEKALGRVLGNGSHKGS